MTDDVETEFKLRATAPLEVAMIDTALRDLGVTVLGSDTFVLDDSYLDDDRGSLRAAGIGLRLRESPGRRQLTCKTGGPSSGGLCVRREFDLPWADARPPQTAAELPAPLRDRVEPFVLDRPLRTFLRLTTARDVRRIGDGDTALLCELTIDRVRAHAGERSVAFDEVELEVASDAPATERLAQSLRERLPLHAADTDQPTHACRELGLAPPANPEIDADTPLGVAVRAATARHLLVLRHAEAAVRSDGDTEAVHTMRVAVRRLRSLVRAFAELWSEVDAPCLQELLAVTGRQLGLVRDLDVLLATLDDPVARLPKPLRSAGLGLVHTLTAARQRAHAGLLEWLRTDGRRHDHAELEALLMAGTRGPAPVRSGDEVQRHLARAATRLRKRVRTIAPELPAEPLHQLRIACKRLRYLAEEFAMGHALAKALKKITALQQTLGIVRDQESLADRLLAELSREPAADAPLRAAAIGALVMRATQVAAKARKRAQRALASTDRKRVWKQFAVDTARDDDDAADASAATDLECDTPPPT